MTDEKSHDYCERSDAEARLRWVDSGTLAPSPPQRTEMSWWGSLNLSSGAHARDRFAQPTVPFLDLLRFD
jgi:hypothetical protein